MRKSKYLFLLIICISTFVLAACGGDDDPEPMGVDCSTLNASYNGDIALIISTSCVNPACHGGNNPNIPEYAQDFSNFSGLEGITANGQFEARVLDQKNMPPQTSLTQAQLDLLQCWADAGFPEN